MDNSLLSLSTLSCNSSRSKTPAELTRETGVLNSSPIGRLHLYGLLAAARLQGPLVWMELNTVIYAGKEGKDFSLLKWPVTTREERELCFC